MTDKGWSTLYISIPTRLKHKIEAAAAAEDRKVAKWVERVLTAHFEKVESCPPISSTHGEQESSSSQQPSSQGWPLLEGNSTNPPHQTDSTS